MKCKCCNRKHYKIKRIRRRQPKKAGVSFSHVVAAVSGAVLGYFAMKDPEMSIEMLKVISDVTYKHRKEKGG